MRVLVLCNRILWALLLVVVLAYLAGHAWLARTAREDAPAAPLPVPPAMVGAVPAPEAPVLPPHELFALGKETAPAPARPAPAPETKTARVAAPAREAIRGILRFDRFAGAFTEDGFVPEGAEFEGARVSRIAPDAIDFELGPDAQTRLPLAAGERASLAGEAELRVRRVE